MQIQNSTPTISFIEVIKIKINFKTSKMKKSYKRKIRKTNGLKTKVVWLALMLFFLAELLLYAWCRVQCVQVGYAISKEIERNVAFVSLEKKLNTEFAYLQSPERIALIAKKQFNLKAPVSKQIIVIR